MHMDLGLHTLRVPLLPTQPGPCELYKAGAQALENFLETCIFRTRISEENPHAKKPMGGWGLVIVVPNVCVLCMYVVYVCICAYVHVHVS